MDKKTFTLLRPIFFLSGNMETMDEAYFVSVFAVYPNTGFGFLVQRIQITGLMV